MPPYMSAHGVCTEAAKAPCWNAAPQRVDDAEETRLVGETSVKEVARQRDARGTYLQLLGRDVVNVVH